MPTKPLKPVEWIGSSLKDLRDFPRAVYVLHAFQKTSKAGIKTPKADIDLVRRRLKLAEERHKQKGGSS